MKERRLKPGGFSRSQRRRREYTEAAKEADGELRRYQDPGESSIVFLAERNESGEIFNETTEIRLGKIQEELRGRNADLSKRRAKGINLMLENPETPRAPETLNSLVFFLQNNWDRIRRFGRTLKNKRRLSSAAKRELGL